MKKISFFLFIIAAAFTACEPLDDIYNELDAQDKPVVADVQYTLTDEDYEDLDLSFGSFSSLEDAKILLPPFLADKYPFYGEGSSVTVGFELFRGRAEGVDDYTGADVLTLTNNDYAAAGSNAFGFYPDANTDSDIADILEAQIDSPSEGQIILVEYNQYLEEPEVGLATIVEYNFNGNLEGFESRNVVGENEFWEPRSFGGAEYAYMSGFDGGPQPNEDWLISPEIDLTDESDLRLQINQAINFASDLSLLNVLIATDYTTGGDLEAANWETIEFETAPSGDSYTFFLSEDFDISAYDGETIHIAFKYESTDSESAVWQIDQLLVKALGVSGDFDVKGQYFVYEGGEWDTVDNVYYLSREDYDSMGESSGQPGRFNNFSNSVPADFYIPTFLELNYPYATEGEEIRVIYKYFSSSAGGVQTRGNLYTFMDGEWMPYQSTISTTLQFGFENGVWVPDNTIRYTFASEDYELVGNTLENEPGFELAAGNLLTFGNFNRTGGSTNWSDAMILRAIGIVLNNINPSAEEGQKYIVTIDVYIGSSSTQSFRVIKENGEWVYQS